MENKTTALIALVVGLLVGLNWPKIRAFFVRQKEALLLLPESRAKKEKETTADVGQVEPKMPFEAAEEQRQQPGEEEPASNEEEELPEAGDGEEQQPEGAGGDQERKETRTLKKRKKRR